MGGTFAEGERSVRVVNFMRGTATRKDPTHPFFEAGKYVSLYTSTIYTFNDDGRVKNREVSLFWSAAPSSQPSTLAFVLNNVLALSETASGSRILQYALENADVESQMHIVQRFRNGGMEAGASPHANHVLQKIIRLFSPEKLGFIASELEGSAVEAAQHRTQCRVLERVIEHFPNNRIETLVHELLDSVAPLCRHAFGNFIVQSILAHG